jgi:hypothetical protein
MIQYRKGYKYQLVKTTSVQTEVYPPDDIQAEYIDLTSTGLLTNKEGYAWDGCSGPTWDDKTNIHGGLTHDSLYQLMRMGLLAQRYKEPADRELQKQCILDGMGKIRAWYYYQGVHLFGGSHCRVQVEEIYEAP